MKNKIFKTLTACLLAVVSLLTLAACNEGHKHNFTVNSVDEAYLATEATCSAAATYYYSCECGEKGGETFSVGEPHHNYDENNVCKYCSQKENFTPGLDIRLSSDGTYAIVWGVGEASAEQNIYIPSTYQGKHVTEILTQAFKGCTAKTITLPWTITKIGIQAFQGCKSLTSFTVPENVVYIGSMAFDNSGLNYLYFKDINGWYKGRENKPELATAALSPTLLKDAAEAADSFKSKSGAASHAFKK